MNHISAVARHMERLRDHELSLVDHYFNETMTVLEIGGGNGFQASKLAELGCNVKSIDLPDRKNKSKHFNVIDYDGRNIPFQAEIFDIVFTSNVLEHINDVDNIMGELKRVLKPSGLAICIMPTPSWRFWTILNHYPYLIGAMLKRLFSKSHVQSIQMTNMVTFIPPAHGVYRSAFHELYYYSQWRWTKVFRINGFEMVDCYPTGVFCTGYAITPFFGITVRKKLAYILGSAGNIFIVSRIN